MTKPSKKEPRLSLFAGGSHLARMEPARPARAKKVARPAVKRLRPGGDERLDARTRGRIVDELDAALKRKPASEARLSGILRVLGPLSAELRGELHRVGEVLVRRSSLTRELWSSVVRTLAETDHPGLSALLAEALAQDDGGGSSTLSSAGFSASAELVQPLGKLASGGKPFVAFAAEVARVVRGDSPGAHLLHLAPIIKEAHRVAIATNVVAPLVRALSERDAGMSREGRPSARSGERLGPGFEVLRSAERHLGRWLLFAEAVVLAGDLRPLAEAHEKSLSGPESSRGAWTLVAWALAHARSRKTDAALALPQTRPTTELAARLSDRPSADRDLSFLFRLASASVPSSKPMLESLVRGPIDDEPQVRAALHLARSFGRSDLLVSLRAVATTSPREELRGLAMAALHDAGDVDTARALAEEALLGKHLGNMAWAARLVAASNLASHPSRNPSERSSVTAELVVTEAAVRHLQWGAVE